jgi:hypothetical protein
MVEVVSKSPDRVVITVTDFFRHECQTDSDKKLHVGRQAETLQPQTAHPEKTDALSFLINI